jgi:hypothetical protein
MTHTNTKSISMSEQISEANAQSQENGETQDKSDVDADMEPRTPPPLPSSVENSPTERARKTDRMGVFFFLVILICLYLGISYPLGAGDVYLTVLICLAGGTAYAVYLDMRKERLRQEVLLHAVNVQYAGMTQIVGAAVARLQPNPEDLPEDGFWTIQQGNVRRIFEPGRLVRIADAKMDTEHVYKYEEDGTVVGEVYAAGIRRYLIRTTQLGAPLAGFVYDEDGNVEVEYSYDAVGQVAARVEETAGI